MSVKGGTPVAAAAEQPPFLLLAGCDPQILTQASLEPMFRRMGLEPSAATVSAATGRMFAGLPLTVGFSDQRALAGIAAPEISAPPGMADKMADRGPTLMCVPLGLTGGDRVSRSRELFKLVVLLIDLCSASQLYWSRAALWSDARQFKAAVAEMLTSGMPPVLHLVAFARTNGGSMRTRGLAHFAGQELELCGSRDMADEEIVRRLARLAIDIMINGAVQARRDFPGLVSGERIRVEPADGLLHVSIMSE